MARASTKGPGKKPGQGSPTRTFPDTMQRPQRRGQARSLARGREFGKARSPPRRLNEGARQEAWPGLSRPPPGCRTRRLNEGARQEAWPGVRRAVVESPNNLPQRRGQARSLARHARPRIPFRFPRSLNEGARQEAWPGSLVSMNLPPFLHASTKGPGKKPGQTPALCTACRSSCLNEGARQEAWPGAATLPCGLLPFAPQRRGQARSLASCAFFWFVLAVLGLNEGARQEAWPGRQGRHVGRLRLASTKGPGKKPGQESIHPAFASADMPQRRGQARTLASRVACGHGDAVGEASTKGPGKKPGQIPRSLTPTCP